MYFDVDHLISYHACTGQFADGMSGQCCGGVMVAASQTCCFEGDMGVSYLPVEGYVCCGMEYVNMVTSLCCTSESGIAEVSQGRGFNI